jgi:hypothetical protein
MKKILFKISFSVIAASVTLLTLNSNNANFPGGMSTSGCNNGSGCHGTSNNNTQMTLAGIPTSNEVNAGQTYTITLVGTNPDTSLSRAGFNLSCSAGTFVITGTALGPKKLINSMEVSHDGYQIGIAGSNAWDVKWTAPNSGSVTFNFACNKVNNDGGTTGDQWNNANRVVNVKPNSIQSFNKAGYKLFPNPVQSVLTITCPNNKKIVASAYSFNGTRIPLKGISNGIETMFDCQNLSTGNYVLNIYDGLDNYQVPFIKK